MSQSPEGSATGTSDSSRDRERVEEAVRDLRTGKAEDRTFDFLFGRFTQPLIRQFMRWGADADEARDLNQETFQRIFQSMESFQGEERVFESWVAWIWKIARTTWLRNLRRKRAAKRPQDVEPLEEVEEPSSLAPAQLERMLTREAQQQVKSAINALPEQELKCVILFYYQGLKTREISVVLRIAPGTVKAHLSHARSKLKARLGDYFDLEGERPSDLRREGHLV